MREPGCRRRPQVRTGCTRHIEGAIWRGKPRSRRVSALPSEAPGRPDGWERTTAGLLAEADFLARGLGHARVGTPGSAGILNDSAPSTVWVHDEVDVDALLRELDGWHPCPGVMVPEHAESVAKVLAAHGWDTGSLV